MEKYASFHPTVHKQRLPSEFSPLTLEDTTQAVLPYPRRGTQDTISQITPESVALTLPNWRFSNLFLSDTDPAITTYEALIKAKTEEFVQIWTQNNTYLYDPKATKKMLDDFSSWLGIAQKGGKLGLYLELSNIKDGNNITTSVRERHIRDLEKVERKKVNTILEKLAFIPSDVQTKLLADPVLGKESHWLQRLWEDPEAILSNRRDPVLPVLKDILIALPEDIANLPVTILLGEGEQTMPFSALKDIPEYASLYTGLTERVSSFGKEERNWGTLPDILLNYKVPIVIGGKERFMRFDDCRKVPGYGGIYKGIASYLTTLSLNNIMKDAQKRAKGEKPEEVFYKRDDASPQLATFAVQAVQENFKLSHGFHELLAQLLQENDEPLPYSKRTTRYGKLPGDFSYLQSVHLTYTALYKIDPQLADNFYAMVKGGKIDPYTHPGRSTQQSSINYPFEGGEYVLLQFNREDPRETTLFYAPHEVGHANHRKELFEKQGALMHTYYSLIISEMAASLFEQLTFQEFAKQIQQQNNPQALLITNMFKLSEEIKFIFRPAALHMFEQELHKIHVEKGKVSPEEISELYAKHMMAYLGDAVVMDDMDRLQWIGNTHIRNHLFYNYTYVIARLLTAELVEKLTNNTLDMDTVQDVFSRAGTESLEKLLSRLGIDPPVVIRKQLQNLRQLFEETKALAENM